MDQPNYTRTRKLTPMGYLYISCPVAWLDDRIYASLPFEAKGLYLDLYLLAGRYNKAGALVDDHGALEVNDIAYLLRCDQTHLSKILELLKLRGLVDLSDGVWTVTAFTKEQVDLNERREEWRKKKRDYRSNKRESEYLNQRQETESELDVEIEEELESPRFVLADNETKKEEEKRQPTHTPPASGASAYSGGNSESEVASLASVYSVGDMSRAAQAIKQYTGHSVTGKDAMNGCKALIDASGFTGVSFEEGARAFAEWWKNCDWRADDSISQFAWSVFSDNIEPVMSLHARSYSNQER